jgi:hypothetical protein
MGKNTVPFEAYLRMYACMYVCIYVCMYVCMYVYVYSSWSQTRIFYSGCYDLRPRGTVR